VPVISANSWSVNSSIALALLSVLGSLSWTWETLVAIMQWGAPESLASATATASVVWTRGSASHYHKVMLIQ
jgi:hypothetical protein